MGVGTNSESTTCKKEKTQQGEVCTHQPPKPAVASLYSKCLQNIVEAILYWGIILLSLQPPIRCLQVPVYSNCRAGNSIQNTYHATLQVFHKIHLAIMKINHSDPYEKNTKMQLINTTPNKDRIRSINIRMSPSQDKVIAEFMLKAAQKQLPVLRSMVSVFF